jgi:DNA-binding response OmpR family regulator
VKILVVEDDSRSRDLLSRYLGAKGHVVATAEDGSRALESVVEAEPDLVLLDVHLPVMDGWGVLEAVRRFSHVPVIMVTVRDTTADKLAGLAMGADDYVTKPFDLRELEARIDAVRRRYHALPSTVFRTGEVVLDNDRKEVRVRDQVVALSPREFELLRLLASHPGKTFSSEEIVAAVWPDRDAAAAEDVKKYVHLLRAKIEHDPSSPRLIVTVRGFGYRLAAPAS